MKTKNAKYILGALIALLLFSTAASLQPSLADPLPSWNDGKAKKSIITFVEKVTKEGSPDFVPGPGAHRGLR